jgi:SAM-dependent methyltransferase
MAKAILGTTATDTAGDRDVEARLRSMWNAVAASWAEHAPYAEARGADVAERMLEATRPSPGELVLELACGTGGLGFAAAELVRPGGAVVVSDFAVEMVSVATARAEARGLENVVARQLDLDRVDEPDASYDVVLCREGLMFAVDPAGAAREITRVLRPEGRFAVAVWGPPAANPWLTVVFDAVGAVTGRTVPPPGVPGPFSLSDRDRLLDVFRGTARELVLKEVAVPARAASFEEWWQRTSALAGPLATILRTLPEQARDAIRERARERSRAYETPAGIEFPGLALLLSGRRA